MNSIQSLQTLVNYLHKTLDEHSEAKCVCLCVRIQTHDDRQFRAYLRIYLPELTFMWFMIDKPCVHFISKVFPMKPVPYPRFLQLIDSFSKYGCAWSWIPTNHRIQRYQLLWEQDTNPNREIVNDQFDREMKLPLDEIR